MKESDTRAAISAHIIHRHSSSFPAILTPAARQQDARHVARRHVLLCGGIALALLIGSGVTDPAPATEIPNSVTPSSDPFAAFVSEASQLFGIPASWIRAVMQVESAGDVRSVSPKGAMGLMQIMPETWADLRIRYGLGADPYSQVLPICGNCTIDTAKPASSRPTMPVRRATRSIWQPVKSCRSKHRITSPPSRPWLPESTSVARWWRLR